jgi:hypothetical protein
LLIHVVLHTKLLSIEFYAKSQESKRHGFAFFAWPCDDDANVRRQRGATVLSSRSWDGVLWNEHGTGKWDRTAGNVSNASAAATDYRSITHWLLSVAGLLRRTRTPGDLRAASAVSQAPTEVSGVSVMDGRMTLMA